MSTTILKGVGTRFIEEAEAHWAGRLARVPEEVEEVRAFMTHEHHLVRYYVVLQLPRSRKPLEPEEIGRALRMSGSRVRVILEELERNLFFLVRNEHGAVTWAFPVTVVGTPHHLRFSTGERLDAA